MAKQTVISKKKRGPPPTGKGQLIAVRIQPAGLIALDTWIEDQPDEPSRPEAIRRLIADGLAAQPKKKR
jgi:hypothetical protein